MDDHGTPGTGSRKPKRTAFGFRALTRFLRDERGATSIEYAMIAVGISIAVAAVVFGTGQSLKTGFYDKMNAAVTN